MSQSNVTSRRQLLNMMGLGAGTLFLPSLMGDRRAYAQENVKRLFVYYTPHGPVQQRYTMRPNGPGGWSGTSKTDRDKAYDFALPADAAMWSEILRPLQPLRSKMLVLEGLAMVSALADRSTNNHNAGTSHALTGAKMLFPGGFKQEGGGGDTSFDQRIADHIADPTRIKYLYYTTGGWSPIFRGKAELIGEGSVARAYEKLFPVSKTSDATANWVKTRRKNAIALVKQEYDRVLPKLSGEDKKKLTDHFDLVSDLEKSISYRSTAVCDSKPESNPGDGGAATVMNRDTPVSRPKVLNFGKIVTAALACDMTRVGILTNGGFSQGEATSHLDVHTDLHLDIAHNATAANADAALKMRRYYATLAKEFADIAAGFDAVDLGGGKTLLDQTMCVWLCELANGPHDMHDIMAVVAGGGGFSGFNLGRYVKFKEDLPAPRVGMAGPAHNKLLVSAMQAFGMTDNTIGMTKMSTGGKYDLDGPLAGLKG